MYPQRPRCAALADRGCCYHATQRDAAGTVIASSCRLLIPDFATLSNKIWCSYRAKRNEFALDESTDYIGLTNTTVIFDTDPKHYPLKYLLALLNSNVLNFRYRSIGKQTGGGIFEYFENGVGKLPIPVATSAQQKQIISFVDKILAAKAKDAQADTSELESQIDALVYDLYGLTEEEIAVVEGGK